jgi:L-asparaginase/Glu-tRNA(Gln) amidotransferase subunit D
MSAKTQQQGRSVIAPTEDAMEFILDSLSPTVKDKFANIEAKPAEKLIDSSQATAGDLAKMVNIIRARLQESKASDFLVLSGTDSMADFINALGIGIPQKLLGDKSVVVTCAMKHLECQDSDATTNIARSIKLFDYPNIQGKVGLMFGERFFPPRGIEKVQLGSKFPFIGRFHRIARYHPEDRQWVFRKQMPYDNVYGNPNDKFRMINGVEEYPLTTTSKYQHIPDAIRHNRATILVALGNGNIRSDQDSVSALRKAAREARGPVVVVGRAIHNSEDEMPPQLLEDVYSGDASFVNALIPAGAMTVTETRVYVSHLVANLNARNITDKNRVNEFVQSHLATYPFRTHESSARPIEEE